MLTIENTTIGTGSAAYIIAEAGVNVRGDMELSKAFIDQAAEANADAIKFQTHLADSEMVHSEMERLGMGDLYQRMDEYAFTPEDHRELQRYCRDRDIHFLSTPFSVEGVSLLDEIDVPALKIGSGELTNYQILKRAADTGKPLLLSTGMSDWRTVRDAVAFLRQHDATFALLYCISEYPTPLSDFNLGVIDQMRGEFEVPIGFSDHSTGIEASQIAVARGADVVEKHFTIDRALPGGDQEVSIEPAELAALTEFIRACHATRGTEKRLSETEASIAEWAHHSIVTSERIEAGDRFTTENITTKRPGTGVPASEYYDVVGLRAATDLDANTVLKNEDIPE